MGPDLRFHRVPLATKEETRLEAAGLSGGYCNALGEGWWQGSCEKRLRRRRILGGEQTGFTCPWDRGGCGMRRGLRTDALLGRSGCCNQTPADWRASTLRKLKSKVPALAWSGQGSPPRGRLQCVLTEGKGARVLSGPSFMRALISLGHESPHGLMASQRPHHYYCHVRR